MALRRGPHVREATGDAIVMFWLVVLMCINVSEGVQCLTCKDNISPEHDTDACPLTTTVATNVAALTAVAGTMMSVAKLLPIKVVRLFPRAILDALKAITQRPVGTFDYNGKTVQQVFQAAVHGHTSTDEALMWMQDQLLNAPNGTEVTRISKSMDLVKTMGAERFATTQNVQGAHQYLWALTDRCVHEPEVARISAVTLEGDEQKMASFNLKLYAIRNTQCATQPKMRYALRNTQYAMRYAAQNALRNTQYAICNTHQQNLLTTSASKIRNTQYATRYAAQNVLRNTQYAIRNALRNSKCAA